MIEVLEFGACRIKKPVDLMGCQDVICGNILAIRIRCPNQVCYFVVWYDGQTRNEDWFDSFEVEAENSDSQKMKIGFSNGQS